MKDFYTLALMNKCNIDLMNSNKGSYPDEELWARAITYEIQQCVEKLLKHILIKAGKRNIKTHDIDRLIAEVDNLGTSYDIPKLIREKAALLTSWEACSRYNNRFVYDAQIISDMYDGLKELLLAVESV